ncbi:hypothetical protein Nepgr_026334 [Nepenthes gracilis]|uniref:Gamma-secretase subunit PEN-2 n=1 Tax=Nepenthes gracilis TaxID=150966 RepID=A0AAD3T8E4_NEPGR|nr:hypothetical protein Nepgr_026334 [Nepenthes gracilis]
MDREDGSGGEASLLPIHSAPVAVDVSAAATTTTTTNDLTSPTRRIQWPTIDGPLGLSGEESLPYARKFYKFGFFLLPWLWALNCFYFWPVLRHSRAFPSIRPYVVRSAIGFTLFTLLLSSWALMFSIGGENLFGPLWDKLLMDNVANELGLTGWM